MKRLLAPALTLALLTGTQTVAANNDVEFSANVSVVSKYIWRGYNLNDDPSMQGGFDVSSGGLYAGTWGGTDSESGTEIDIYAGYGFAINDSIALDIGYTQYRYDEISTYLDEYHIGVDVSMLNFVYHLGEDDYSYIEVNTTFEISDQLALGLHLGSEDSGASGEDSLMDYSLGLEYAFDDRFSGALLFSNKDDYDSAISVGITAAF